MASDQGEIKQPSPSWVIYRKKDKLVYYWISPPMYLLLAPFKPKTLFSHFSLMFLLHYFPVIWKSIWKSIWSHRPLWAILHVTWNPAVMDGERINTGTAIHKRYLPFSIREGISRKTCAPYPKIGREESCTFFPKTNSTFNGDCCLKWGIRGKD